MKRRRYPALNIHSTFWGLFTWLVICGARLGDRKEQKRNAASAKAFFIIYFLYLKLFDSEEDASIHEMVSIRIIMDWEDIFILRKNDSILPLPESL